MNTNYIDLGLPSGTLWAKCNIGAEKETDYGDYFMWGSITPDTNNICDWEHTPFNNKNKFNDEEYFNEYKSEWLDENDNLKPEYDAAHVIMGGNWRMPTDIDFIELLNGTTNVWVENYKGSGKNGILFTSKTNGRTIFIPAAGRRFGSSFYDQGVDSNVWSSLFFKDDFGCYCSWRLNFDSDDYNIFVDIRYYGFSVRGVMNLKRINVLIL